MMSKRDDSLEGTTREPIGINMATGMSSHLQGAYVTPEEAMRLCKEWREASDPKTSTYRDFIAAVYRKGGIVGGLCSIGFFDKPTEVCNRLKLSPDALAIYDDWFVVGQDLCEAIVKYTMTEHCGRSTEPEAAAPGKSSR